jgi:hypothetical protein
MQPLSLVYAMQKVKVFHDAADIETPDFPTWPSVDRIKLRASLMREESRETLDGHYGRFAKDQTEPGMAILDGCLDTVYVVAGTNHGAAQRRSRSNGHRRDGTSPQARRTEKKSQNENITLKPESHERQK